MNLLREERWDGYPTSYVLARLRARRSGFTSDWLGRLSKDLDPAAAEEILWRRFLEELFWVHRQMNRKLRKVVAPVLLYFELRTLVLCLRNKAARNEAALQELLTYSLLPEAVRKALRGTADAPAAVAGVTESLTALSPRYRDLTAGYVSGGLRVLEEKLVRTFLEERVRDGGHRAVQTFFADVIDLRNLLGAYKQLRWEMEETPTPYIAGGRIPARRLHEWIEAGNAEDLSGLMGREFRAARGVSVEIGLLRALTLRLHHAGRGLDAVGPIVEYLWRRYTEMRNLRVLYFGKAIDPERLAAELIR